MEDIKQFHKNLLSWYKKCGRDHLPWRNTDDIYHIYISEIMLQQTQVNRVMNEFYPNFLEKFPTLEVLANSPIEVVLASWSGLGYYSRARNIHKTANECPKQLPDDMSELLKLPGIGRYTASAICSFGYEQNVSVVDTNISRVLKRYCGFVEVKDEVVWSSADTLLNHKEPRSHNLALMDLGSMVCTPTNPKCDECPLSDTCKGKNEPELYTKKKKTVYEAMDLFFAICIKDNHIALTKSTGKMYKGMLVLPSTDPIDENLLTTYKHSYTKYRLTVHLYKVEKIEGDEIIWINIEDIDTLHISTLTKKGLEKIV
ncbi:A/G-specific adenine glycosylase [Arcobacteraceae bacterium]|nr:A/G-specific adenine glycosylase [Arcobacteraceae bacterium]